MNGTKIWFDLSNAPHINLFKDMLKDLQEEGNEVVVTCRPLSNTIELLNLHKIKYTIVGEHYGKNFLKKAMGYPIRVLQLYKFLKPLKVTTAISQSSFHSPLVAKLLGVPSIYMNDNEHAMGNKLSFIFAKKILIPEFLDKEKVKKQGASEHKIISYPGVKEGIYLWKQYLNVEPGNAEKLLVKEKIYIRPEPRTAQYYKGALNFLDDIIVALKDTHPVVVLTRDSYQQEYYKGPKFNNVSVPDKPISFDEIVKECMLFIGAGGTMTREMAVVGTPTISAYQEELLDVDKYLVDIGLMKHSPHITIQELSGYLNQDHAKLPEQGLLLKGRESYYLIKKLLKEI